MDERNDGRLRRLVRGCARDQVKLAQAVEQLAIIGHLDALRAEGAAKQVNASITRIEGRLDQLEAAVAEADGLTIGSYGTADPDDTEAIIEAAIRLNQVIRFVYEDRDGVASVRTLSPYEWQEPNDEQVLVMGFDHDREALRHFDLSRIECVGTVPEDEYREPSAS